MQGPRHCVPLRARSSASWHLAGCSLGSVILHWESRSCTCVQECLWHPEAHGQGSSRARTDRHLAQTQSLKAPPSRAALYLHGKVTTLEELTSAGT